MVNTRNNGNGQGNNTNNQVNSQFEQIIANQNQLMQCNTQFLLHKIFAKLGVHKLAFLENFSLRKDFLNLI
jgi:hypothetical protein